jgi:hypothetical protein
MQRQPRVQSFFIFPLLDSKIDTIEIKEIIRARFPIIPGKHVLHPRKG